MKTIEIKGLLRKDLGKKASAALRKKDDVPCVLYGGEENVNFHIPSLALKNLVYTPNVYIVKLNVEGKEYDCFMKEIQFHPVSDKINHIDFVQIFQDKPVVMNIPVHTTGNSIGIKKGGKLRLANRTLKVKGLPKNLPDFLEINVEDIDVGQTVKVGDLNYKDISILNSSYETIVSVRVSRVTTKAEEEGEAAEAAAAAAIATPTPTVPETEEQK